MLGLGASLAKGGASLLTFVKDNLKLYLDFKSNRSDTLAFPSEGSTEFTDTDNQHIDCGVQIATDLGGSFNTAFTVSFWLYRTVTNNNCGMFYIGTFADANGKIQIYTSTDTLKFRINNVDQLDIASFSANNSGWNHIAFTWNASKTTSIVYINGVAQTPKTNSESSIAFTSSMKTIIGNYYGAGFPLNGKMANVGFWKRDLSLEEIQSVMNKSYSQLGSVEKTSLVMWQSLDSQQVIIGDYGIVYSNDGEVLGSELLPLLEDIKWVKSASGDKHRVSNGFWEYDDGNNRNITSASEYTIQDAGIYKVTFDISDHLGVTAGAKLRLRIDGSNLTDVWGTSDQNSSILNSGSHTFYFTISTALSSPSTIRIEARSVGTALKLSNLSIKKTSNTGVVTGATTTASVYGGNAPILPRAIDIAESQAEQIGDGSALFNGSSDFVEVADSSILQPNGNMTLTAWINPTGTTSFRAFVMKRDAGGDNYSFYLSDDNPPKLRFFDGSTATSSTGTITKDEWQHVALSINSGVTDGSVFYINGIASGTATFTITADDAPLTIGKHQTDDTYYNGEISQVGIWQGALTSEQVRTLAQDVTSYAKIPADVKSTLGSELVSEPSFASSTGWATDYFGTGWSIAENKLVSDGTQSAGSNASADITTSAGLYKATITVDSLSSGTLRPNFETWGSYISTTGTHIQYFKLTGNNDLTIQANADFVGSVSFVSVKEVTNDLVGYWGLDEAKHLSPSAFGGVFGAVVDSTTGENLGAELFTGWINTDCATFSYNSSTKELTATCDGGNQEVHASFSIESGKVYRFGFTTGENHSATVALRGIVNDTSLELYSSSPEINKSYLVTEDTYALYVRATATGTRYVGFRGSSGLTIHITNFSIKEADSNMGLLI